MASLTGEPTGFARWAGRTHTGAVRPGNEDAWGVRVDAGVAAVADGVGGAPGGERASRIAVDAALEVLSRGAWPDEDGGLRRRAIRAAHRTIVEAWTSEPRLRGMATTLTAVRWRGERVEGVHVGDSRAYLVGVEALQVLTRDHTPPGGAVVRGELPREALHGHPEGHLLLQVVGGGAEAPEPDLFELDPLATGGGILLCSDGVDAALPEARLEEILRPVLTGADPEAVLDVLVERALEGGAPDNVTAVLLLGDG